MSDEESKKILQDRLSEINKEIRLIENRLSELKNISISLSSKLHGLENEKQRVEDQIKDFTERDTYGAVSEFILGMQDERRVNLEEKENELKEKINQLNEEKKSTNNRYLQKRIDIKIQKLQYKMKVLRQKGAKVQGRQRKILMFKMKKDAIKQRLYSKEEGLAMAYEDRVEAYNELKNNNDSKIFHDLTSKIYDMKAKHYQKKYDRTMEVLKEMDGKSIIAMRGARVIALNKRISNKMHHVSEPAPIALSA